MKILVILATYNGEKYIREQLDSILEQKSVDVDIYIFDDISIDGTIQIVKDYQDENRIKLINNNFRQGSAANNFFGAIKFFHNNFLSEYDYISFSDQDDIWLSEKLLAATNLLKIENSSLYVSNLILWEEKTGKKSIIKKAYSQKKYDFLFEGGSAGCTYVFTSSFCIALKSTIINIDYTNWKFFSHDWFVYFFARINNYKVSIDSNAYILYRIHDTNVHGQLNVNSLFAFKERIMLVRNGWYIDHVSEYIKMVPEKTKSHLIYKLYLKNYFTRCYVVLRYNFQLIRSTKKMIQFVLLSFLPIKSIK